MIAISHAPIDWTVAALIGFAIGLLFVVGLGRAAKAGDREPRPIREGQFYSWHGNYLGRTDLATGYTTYLPGPDSDIDLPLPRNTSGVVVRPK